MKKKEQSLRQIKERIDELILKFLEKTTDENIPINLVSQHLLKWSVIVLEDYPSSIEKKTDFLVQWFDFYLSVLVATHNTKEEK